MNHLQPSHALGNSHFFESVRESPTSQTPTTCARKMLWAHTQTIAYPWRPLRARGTPQWICRAMPRLWYTAPPDICWSCGIANTQTAASFAKTGVVLALSNAEAAYWAASCLRGPLPATGYAPTACIQRDRGRRWWVRRGHLAGETCIDRGTGRRQVRKKKGSKRKCDIWARAWRWWCCGNQGMFGW